MNFVSPDVLRESSAMCRYRCMRNLKTNRAASLRIVEYYAPKVTWRVIVWCV